MMKRLAVLFLVLVMAALPALSCAEEAFDASGLIDWFNESNTWMTVANGHWSSDAADKPTDEQLTKMFSMATKQQNAVHWTPWYFVVVKDVEEQRKIIGDAWGDPNDMATEGTVTVLVLADQIMTAEQGHVTPYDGYYMPTTFAYYDAGLTCGLLEVAAASLGYQTHYFGTINGEYAPSDLADGAYKSMNRYVAEGATRAWGFRSAYGGEIDESFTYPVSGNCVFVAAIVMGKPAADETIETWGTNHARPENWAIWDGVPNEAPLPVAAPAQEAAPAAEAADAAAQTAENEFIGVGAGMGGDVKVKITVADGKLTAVEVVEQQETEGIGDKAIAALPEAIIAAQSTEVDGVSGATITSDAIKTAVADAMAQAGL